MKKTVIDRPVQNINVYVVTFMYSNTPTNKEKIMIATL